MIQLVFEQIDFFLELLFYVFRHFLKTFVPGEPGTGGRYKTLL
jgi:hypothetical protein